MTRYRKLPVEIDAEVYHPGLEDAFGYLLPEGGFATLTDGAGNMVKPDQQIHGELVPLIETLEGWHIVSPGDFIITGIAGERYPCKPEIFAKTFVPVSLAAGAQPIIYERGFGPGDGDSHVVSPE